MSHSIKQRGISLALAFLMVFTGLNPFGYPQRAEAAVARTAAGFGGMMMGAKAGALLGASLGAIGGPVGLMVGTVAGAIGGGLGGGAVGGRIGGWLDSHVKVGKNAGMISGGILGAGIGLLVGGPVGLVIGGLAGGLIGRFFGGAIDKLVTPMRVAKWGGAVMGMKAGAAIGTAVLPVGGTVLGGIAGFIAGKIIGSKAGPAIDRLFGGQGKMSYAAKREGFVNNDQAQIIQPAVMSGSLDSVLGSNSMSDPGVRAAFDRYQSAQNSYSEASKRGDVEGSRKALTELLESRDAYESMSGR